jgi:hypothetical protein
MRKTTETNLNDSLTLRHSDEGLPLESRFDQENHLDRESSFDLENLVDSGIPVDSISLLDSEDLSDLCDLFGLKISDLRSSSSE